MGYNINKDAAFISIERALNGMEQAKFKAFCFLLWYIPLFISATGDKYFNLPSCMLINLIRTSHPNITVFLLWVIPAVFFLSFTSKRLHRYICVLLCVDGLFGYSWAYFYRNHSIWIDIPGHKAYFWKPFFNNLNLGLKEKYLFCWGSYASLIGPFVLFSANAGFLKKRPKSEDNNESKITPYKQKLRDKWRKDKMGLIMFYCGVFISIAMGFYIIKGTYYDNARRSEQIKQEFRLHLEAADRGNVPSMARVGFLYWDGDGTEHNTPEAIRWWEKGAEHGSTDAMVFLGSAYYSGYRTGRDWDKARRWLTAAVETDPEKAKDARMILDRIDKGLLPHQ